MQGTLSAKARATVNQKIKDFSTNLNQEAQAMGSLFSNVLNDSAYNKIHRKHEVVEKACLSEDKVLQAQEIKQFLNKMSQEPLE